MAGSLRRGGRHPSHTVPGVQFLFSSLTPSSSLPLSLTAALSSPPLSLLQAASLTAQFAFSLKLLDMTAKCRKPAQEVSARAA